MGTETDARARSFRVQASTGVELACDLYEHGAPNLAVVSHGIFADRSLPELQRLARRLSKRVDVLTFDCRGHGDSGGRFSFGLHEWRDLADLCRQLGASYDRVVGIGFSVGGFHTCVAAAQAACFASVMLVSTPKDFYVADHWFLGRGLWKSMPLMAQRQRRRARFELALGKRTMPIDCIERIDVPVHIVHGDQDWLIHHRHAVELHRRAPVPTELTLLEGGVHAEYLIAQMPERFLPLVDGWLQAVAPHAADA